MNSKLTPEDSRIKDIIDEELAAALYKVMEVKALNRAIYSAAEEELGEFEQLENLYLLLKAQEQILDNAIDEITLVDDHISCIIYHRE